MLYLLNFMDLLKQKIFIILKVSLVKIVKKSNAHRLQTRLYFVDFLNGPRDEPGLYIYLFLVHYFITYLFLVHCLSGNDAFNLRQKVVPNDRRIVLCHFSFTLFIKRS